VPALTIVEFEFTSSLSGSIHGIAVMAATLLASINFLAIETLVLRTGSMSLMA